MSDQHKIKLHQQRAGNQRLGRRRGNANGSTASARTGLQSLIQWAWVGNKSKRDQLTDPSGPGLEGIKGMLALTTIAMLASFSLAAWGVGRTYTNRNRINALDASLMLVNDTLTNEINTVSMTLDTKIDLVNSSLTTSIETVNTTLCNKIMILETRVDQEIDMLQMFANMTSEDLMAFLVNATGQFANLTSDVEFIQDNFQVRIQGNCTGMGGIASVDSAGDVTCAGDADHAMDDLTDVDTTGVMDNHALTYMAGTWIPMSVVKNIEGEAPASSGNMDVAGVGGIVISTAASQVIVDGTVLETAINNLDATVSMHSMDISDLQDKDMTLMNQIDALNITAQIIIEQGGLVLNMTLAEMMMDIMQLKADVAALQASSAGVSTGTIVPWGGTEMNVPTGYLFCDGAFYDSTVYVDLFNVIGMAYGSNATHFAVPDLRGSVPVGMLTGSPNFGTRGQVSGEEEHTMLETEVAGHTHTVTGTVNSAGSHTHTTDITFTDTGGVSITDSFVPVTGCQTNPPGTCRMPDIENVKDFTGGLPSPAFANVLRYGTTSTGSHSHTFSSGATNTGSGSATPFNVVQPSVAVGGYMIKT